MTASSLSVCAEAAGTASAAIPTATIRTTTKTLSGSHVIPRDVLSDGMLSFLPVWSDLGQSVEGRVLQATAKPKATRACHSVSLQEGCKLSVKKKVVLRSMVVRFV